jgi:hypothetical protein
MAGTRRLRFAVARALLVIGGLALGLGSTHALAETEPADAAAPPVGIQRDRITGDFTGMSVEDALRQIATATGADVVGTVVDDRQITLKLNDVPLEVAMQRILGTQSFSLVFDGQGGLRRIRLINAPAATAPSTARVPATPATAVTNPAQLFAIEVPISTVGPLAEALGTGGKASLQQLFELAARSDDAGVRVAAIDASMAAIERDANLQGSIDRMLSGVDNESLAMMIRSSAGERATELMSRVLSRTRRPEFRQRVVDMLRSLRETRS